MSSVIPLAFADESENISNGVEIDAQTQKQTEIMNDVLGAEIRLLQLERSILKNINIGNEILLLVNESDINITDLQVILAEFELLIEEVQSADPHASDAVSIFVDLKHDAVNLSKEFRETVRELLTNTMLHQLQQQIRNMTPDQTQDLSEIIKNKLHQYNCNQFRNIYRILGENGSKQIECYQNGSMTQNQVIQNISMRVNQTEKENKFSFLSSLKQQKIRNRIQSQNQVQNASEGFQQRQENRFKKRLQRIEDFPDNPLHNQLMKRIQNKLNNIDDEGSNGNGGNGSNNGKDDDSGSGQKKPGYDDNGGSKGAGGGS